MVRRILVLSLIPAVALAVLKVAGDANDRRTCSRRSLPAHVEAYPEAAADRCVAGR